MSCVDFLLWKLGNCGVPGKSIVPSPSAVQQLNDIIIPSYQGQGIINETNVSGYQVANLVGGVINCPSSFNLNSLNKVKVITGHLNNDQVGLLTSIIETLIAQSARQNVGKYHTFLIKQGVTIDNIVRMINSEIEEMLTPSLVNTLLDQTQPQPQPHMKINNLSVNSGVITNDICNANDQLPIILFSAALLTKITDHLQYNSTLKSICDAAYHHFQPSLNVLSSHVPGGARQLNITSNNALIWIFIIILIVIVIVLIYQSRS